MWVWPTSPALAGVAQKFSKGVVAVAKSFWLGSKVLRGETTSESLDVSAFVLGEQMLVLVSNAGSSALSGEVVWMLPSGVKVKL